MPSDATGPRLTGALIVSGPILLLLAAATILLGVDMLVFTVSLVVAGLVFTGSAVYLHANAARALTDPTPSSPTVTLPMALGMVGTYIAAYGAMTVIIGVLLGVDLATITVGAAAAVCGYPVWRRGYAHWHAVLRDRRTAYRYPPADDLI